MIPLAVPQISGREAEYVAECVRSTFVSTVGPFVTQFEQMVARSSGAPFAVATCSGTAGLHAALVAVGVIPGDLVICPTLTFIASANAISHAGGVPWLLDIDPETWNLDPVKLLQELKSNTRRNGDHLEHVPTGRRVRAVLPVHTLGLPADMDSIVAIARDFGLRVVADSAAALGSSYKGRLSGALGADLSVYSFNGNKTVTSGGGGAVVGTDEALVASLRHLTTTARVGSEYLHDRVGYNYRMTNLEAAVGCAQMEQLDSFVAAKRRIAATYDHGFADLRDLSPFPRVESIDGACWFSGIVLNHELSTKSEPLRAKLREKGIDARPFWRPMHLQPPYLSAPRSDVFVADYIWTRVVTLPCSTNLSEADQAHVIETVRGFVQGD